MMEVPIEELKAWLDTLKIGQDLYDIPLAEMCERFDNSKYISEFADYLARRHIAHQHYLLLPETVDLFTDNFIKNGGKYVRPADTAPKKRYRRLLCP